MSEPTNKKLYNYVKKLANEKFQSKSGIYKSSWIVKEYKKRGGKYKGSKPKISGLKRWYKEKWIDLNRPIKNSKGKIIGYHPCGRKGLKSPSNKKSQSKYPLCRPSKRINSKTPKTYKELSKSSIKKAKKEKSKVKSTKNIQFGSGKQQYYGKRSDVVVTVPKNVKKWAAYAFKLKKLGFQGATKTGWMRAKQLIKHEAIPIQDFRYMRNWYARHRYTSYPGFKEWVKNGRPKDESWHNKHAIQSWLTWGGDAGFKWINSKKSINLLNTYFNKNYKPIKALK